MMKLIDILMILLFPLLDSLPFALPRYWLFRDRLRLPFRYIVLLQSILAAIYSVVFYAINRGGYAAAEQWTTITRYSFLLVYLILAFLLIRDRDVLIHVFAVARPGGDKAADDDVFLKAAQVVHLALEGRLGEHLGGFLEGGRRDEGRGTPA